MTERTILAGLAALIVGPFFGYWVGTSVYGGVQLFFFACLFCPLLVSLIADRWVILLALIPNPLIVLTWLIVGEIRRPDEQHCGIQTISAVFLFALPSLLVSIPVYLVRRFLSRRRISAS